MSKAIRFNVLADYDDNYRRVLGEIDDMDRAMNALDAETYPKWDDFEAKRNELIRMFDNTPSFVVDSFESVAPLLQYCEDNDFVIDNNLIHVMKRWSNDIYLMNYLESNKGARIAFLNDRHFDNM